MKLRSKLFLFATAALLALLASCALVTPTPATLAGFWEDNDTNVTNIQYLDGGFVAVTTHDHRTTTGQNTLVSSSYENGVLTWKYCPPLRPCITMTTVSFNGDTLDVTWTNDNGESGQMVLTRTNERTDQ